MFAKPIGPTLPPKKPNQVRVAVTADVHFPMTRKLSVEQLSQQMAGCDADCIIVAGDIANSPTNFDKALEMIKKNSNVPVLVLAGNHDVWNMDGISSQELFEKELPRLAEKNGCVWLEGKALKFGKVGVVGTMGWYDYSAAGPLAQSVPDYEFASLKPKYWNDGKYVDWAWSDRQFSDRLGTTFLKALDDLERDPGVESIVVVTHMPVLPEQIEQKADDRRWQFVNAYIGNLTLGSKILKRKKVTHVISGHSHWGKKAVISLPNNRKVTAEVVPSDYDVPVWTAYDLEK